MIELDHSRSALAALPDYATVYLRPVGFGMTPFNDPASCRRLAGGAVWFGLVQVIARRGTRRTVSVMVPVAEIEQLIGTLPQKQRERVQRQWQALLAPRPPLDLGGGKALRFEGPSVMGILNLTPDSFSDGGLNLDPEVAMETALMMMEQGAAIIDVGAESTRPGAKPVWEGDEIERIRPFAERIGRGGLPWSVDTRKAAVMRFALEQGAAIINDVSALTYDPQSLTVAAASSCPVVLMHHQGDPQTMQDRPAYDDVLLDVFDWLEERVAACEAAGIERRRIILDPGIGFGKSVRHNLQLVNGLGLFHALGCPLLLGVSRKRFIGALSREEPAEKRMPGSIALALEGAEQGVQLFRVHDVAETVQALKVWQGMRDEAMSLPEG